jgi:hypothetical protein
MHPSRDDWWEAATTLYSVPPRWTTPMTHADPLGRIAARARDIMRTRHCSTPAYRVSLAERDRQRRAAEAAADAARATRAAARTAKARAEEEAFYVDGGTSTEWAIEQEAKAEANAQATKKRATARTRSKARSTPRRNTTQGTQ